MGPKSITWPKWAHMLVWPIYPKFSRDYVITIAHSIIFHLP
ncbi:hypothetical protein F383_03778 [Gossypium arboreum]|uniref:Uncharacterized protein n=1 Tax=Gossypium arboreum TaxID=29729 RepID=A0A0B0P1C0_GOSAR|nr:hypothetical protein F383_03778 [Gossypium arboreum]